MHSLTNKVSDEQINVCTKKMISVLDKNGKLLLNFNSDSLRDADLSCANLRGADLICANLRDADLSCVNLIGADLRDADLSCANLRGADLRGANLRGVNLRDADLSGADLSCANLRDADLSCANLIGANLRGADLSGADLIIITWMFWTTYITRGHIRIGCQMHSLGEWKNFTDDEISKMDSEALDFWKENKEIIISLAERFKAIKKQGDQND